MTIGFGLFLIAVGAILNFAVTATVAGIDIQTVGVILMIVGAIAFVISLVFEFSRRSGQRRRRPRRRPGIDPEAYSLTEVRECARRLATSRRSAASTGS